MYAIILKLNDEQIIKDLGKEKISVMYQKIKKAYCDIINMKVSNLTKFENMESVTIYQGNVEWSDIMKLCNSIEKKFPWFNKYICIWLLHDYENDYTENLML